MYAKKEGGYGWLVVAASFLVHFIVGGIGYSSSVFHHIFTTYYQKTALETSWTTSMILGLTALAGIPSVLFVYQFGHRATVMVGGLTAAVGLILSLWCQHLHQIYLTVGALMGIGLGISLTPSITILEYYFYKKHSLALAIAGCGTSLGMFVFPVALNLLEEQLAWKGMILVLVGVTLNIILCGAVFATQNHTLQAKQDLVKLFNPSLFRSLAFNGLIWSNILWGIGISIIYTYLPGYSMWTGEEFSSGVILISVAGISAFSSRGMFEMFSRSAKLDSISMFLCTIGMTLLLTALHPQLFGHYAGQIGYAIMLGLHTGFCSVFLAYITDEFIGSEFMCLGKGYIFLSIFLGFATGGPLGGWILDEKDDYEIIFYLAGACLLASSCILMLICLRKCYYKPQDWNDVDSQSSGESGNRVECKPVVAPSPPPQPPQEMDVVTVEEEVVPLMVIASTSSV